MKENKGKGAKKIIIAGIATIAGICGGLKLYASMKKKETPELAYDIEEASTSENENK